jgi:hypothetical protein
MEEKYSPPNKDANNPPVEWFDPARKYDLMSDGSTVMASYIKQHRTLPPHIEEEVGLWCKWAEELPLASFLKKMREHFKVLSDIDAQLPVNDLLQWAIAMSSSAILQCWLAELLALAEPSHNCDMIAKRTLNALSEPLSVWDAACRLSRSFLPKLSDGRMREQLTNYLADHASVHIWGSKRLDLLVWPETGRTEPRCHEKRDKDMNREWYKTPVKEAVSTAIVERVFQRPPSCQHPLAYKVRIESPTPPSPGTTAFVATFSILPLAIHHKWSSCDIARCVAIACPHLRNLYDPSQYPGARPGEYVRRQLLRPMGADRLVTHRTGRPSKGSQDRQPDAYAAGKLVAYYLQEKFRKQ